MWSTRIRSFNFYVACVPDCGSVCPFVIHAGRANETWDCAPQDPGNTPLRMKSARHRKKGVEGWRNVTHLISSRCDLSSVDRKFSMYTTSGSLEKMCTEYDSPGHCSAVPLVSSSASRLSLTWGLGVLRICGADGGESKLMIGL